MLPPSPTRRSGSIATRSCATASAPRHAGRSWRVVFQSASLTTLEAAIQAGLGIGVFPTGLRLDQVVKIDPKQCDLPSVEPSLFVCERLADTDDAMVDLLHQFLIATAGSGFLAQP